MKIVITGRKCSPRESFKERAEKKLAKVERFFGDEAEAKITATVEKSGQTVEITVINNGMIFRAQERAENMNDALDKCVDSLVRQIRKNKTKLEKRMRSAALMNSMTARMLRTRKSMTSSEQSTLQSSRRRSMRLFFR